MIGGIRSSFLIFLFMNFFWQSNTDFHIYVRKGVYKNQEYFKSHSVFKYYQLLGGNYIDPKGKNEINEERIKKGLSIMYPDKDSNGVLVLDIENQIFEQLKNNSIGSNEYNYSVGEFLKLINIIRDFRPNLKIGIYGLPFRVYFQSQLKLVQDNKLDTILSKCDFISPSLYILYPGKERGVEANKAYLEQNLQIALKYAKRLNKPVIPFVWYVVSPGNKKYGGQIIEKDEMINNIKLVKDYDYEGKSVNGIFWWELSDNAFEKVVKQPDSSHLIKDKTQIIYDYTKPFVN